MDIAMTFSGSTCSLDRLSGGGWGGLFSICCVNIFDDQLVQPHIGLPGEYVPQNYGGIQVYHVYIYSIQLQSFTLIANYY